MTPELFALIDTDQSRDILKSKLEEHRLLLQGSIAEVALHLNAITETYNAALHDVLKEGADATDEAKQSLTNASQQLVEANKAYLASISQVTVNHATFLELGIDTSRAVKRHKEQKSIQKILTLPYLGIRLAGMTQKQTSRTS